MTESATETPTETTGRGKVNPRMPRPLDVRWSDVYRCWLSDCGKPTVDRSGRRRRARVSFREDDDGPIPFGPRPRSEGYRRARAALLAFVEAQQAAERSARPPDPTAADLVRAYLAEIRGRIKREEMRPRSAELASIGGRLGSPSSAGSIPGRRARPGADPLVARPADPGGVQAGLLRGGKPRPRPGWGEAPAVSGMPPLKGEVPDTGGPPPVRPGGGSWHVAGCRSRSD